MQSRYQSGNDIKALYYDYFSGISGDTSMAALVDLGVEQSYLIRELEKLGLQGYSISFKPDKNRYTDRCYLNGRNREF